MYSNYHKHSYYSNIITPDSPVAPEAYAKRATELGHRLLSSLEHGYAGRYVEYYEIAKKYNLKFLFGTEAYFVKNRKEKDSTNAHIVLLAKNENGRKNINRIMSEANSTGFYYKARIDEDLLFSLPKNDVWITTACVAGIWKYEDADKIALSLQENFGNNFFLEVQNHDTETQKSLNLKILDISNHYNIPIIFGCDSHFIYEDQYSERDNYLLSKHITYEDEVGWYLDYPSEEEVLKRFETQGVLSSYKVKQAIENTNILLEVEEYKSDVFNTNVKLPTLYPEKTQDEKNAIFSDLIWSKWKEEKQNIQEEKWEHYEAEIAKELDVVLETSMCDYFMLDYAIVKLGVEKGGQITLTGRGSGVSFYLSKLLGLTTVDRISAPVKLFPERFITKERILETGSLPDFDLNLGNPEVFAEAQTEILGECHSYPMIAFGTMGAKAAWKMYARAKGIDFDLANKVSSQIEKYEMDLKHVSEEEKDSVNILDYMSEEYKDIFKESEKFKGIISDGKIHPCSYLLYQKDIREEVGLIKIKDHLCCLMDGLWAENYHFVKNDLLKVSVVNLIYRVFEKIGQKPLSLNKVIELSKDNKSVWEVYKNAWTMGINQVEQSSTKGRIAKYAPRNISELSAFIAAIRPGFKSNYKQFEAREPFSYGIKSIDSLIQTEEFPHSYMLYQENAMQVMAYAGILVSKTYEIIKNIAKKRVEKVLKYKQEFLDKMKKKIAVEEKNAQSKSEEIANMIWQIIEDSSHYSFNSSHSYSVAGDSLIGAYLKSQYPLEFYEVFLRMLEEDGEKDRYNQAKDEAQRAYGIQFPPFRFGQDNRQIVSNKEKNEITSSLTSIKGFNKKISESLFILGQKKYEDFVDFLIEAEEASCLSSRYEDLIKINYFINFGNNKKLLKIFLEFAGGENRYLKSHSQKTKDSRKLKLKQLLVETPDERAEIEKQIQWENEILGYINSVYPEVSKRVVYVMSIDTKFAPRIECYCLSNGKVNSLKIKKRIFENKPFKKGDILYVDSFKEEPTYLFVDGDYVQSDTEKTWWIMSYNVITKNFDKIIKENSKK